jgi:hypothetical protein
VSTTAYVSRSIEGFEFTQEMNVFDILNIRLVHGWLVHPGTAAATAIGSKTYNELVENVIELREMQSHPNTTGADVDAMKRRSMIQSITANTRVVVVVVVVVVVDLIATAC